MIGLFLNLLDTQSEKDKFIKLYDKYKNMHYWISYGKTQSILKKSAMSIQAKPRAILQRL